MKTAKLLRKDVSKNPTLMPVEKALEMTTIEGVNALSWEGEIRAIERAKGQILPS